MLNKCSLHIDRHADGFRGSRVTYKGFQQILLIFEQFSPILRGIFHHKELGAHIFKQECLFGTIQYAACT